MAATFDVWVPYLHLLFAMALVLAPFADLGARRRLQRHSSSAARISIYRFGTLRIWVLTGIALLLAAPGGLLLLERSASDIPWLLGSVTHMAVTAVLLGLAATIPLGQGVLMGARTSWRRKYAKAAQRFRYFLPVTKEERRWWLFVSVSAGICEELLFRGYLLQFLNGKMSGGPALGLTAAWLVSSAGFGVGHLYQGVRGAITAALGGAVLGLMAILTGDLLLSMVVHGLVDAAALWVYRPLTDDPVEARLLVEVYDFMPESHVRTANGT